MYVKKDLKGLKPQIEPNYASDNIPYDYFVVVDAGSHGSRVFIYSWINPLIGLEKKINFSLKEYIEYMTLKNEDEKNKSEHKDSDADSDHNSDDEDKKKKKPLQKKNHRRRKSDKINRINVGLPKIFNLEHWHYKEHTGLATLHQDSKGIEKHIKSLLRLAAEVVPKSQHYRTPIFVHSTAGMRLIPEDRQKVVLDEVCGVITNQSDFYIPDCSSHINIIDGETEGLYGWLALNYLKGLFDMPSSGDDITPSTYGFLDMGGMSTQVVFQPSKEELEKHSDGVYKVTLSSLPSVSGSSKDKGAEYAVAKPSNYDVSTRSFLGLGESEAHRKFLKYLAQKGEIDSLPVDDPCSPKGYEHSVQIDDKKVTFQGTGKFEECEVSIFSVFSEYYLPSDDNNSDCHDIQSEDHISTCLLSSKYHAFDFEHDKFVGVSEYKQAAADLESLGLLHKKAGKDYDYGEFKKATEKICTKDYEKVKHLANKHKFELQDITKLCFQTSWILNVLHVGLGFPNGEGKESGGPVLQLEEKIDGHKFSWTLGRAVLYANDEYTQAYSNFSIAGDNGEPIQRLGYKTHEDVFVNGAELDLFTRPYFEIPSPSAKYTYYDYESAPRHVSGLWVQSALLFALIGMMIWLYRSGLKQVVGFYDGISRVVLQAKGYSTLGGLGADEGMELNDIENSELGVDDDNDQFVVDSDTDENPH